MAAYLTAALLVDLAIFFLPSKTLHSIRASLWSGQRRIANSGVIAHFNQEYVKTGVFEKGASKIIRNASELREQADYEDFYEATQEEASDVFMQASQFILEVECYLHSKSIL